MRFITASLLLFFVVTAKSQSSQSPNNTSNGVILHGYDAVSYFTGSKAQKGQSKFAVAYKGATYYFATEANKELFKNNPAKYAPQYNGWCAYAMGKSNELVDIDPSTFKIINGKLYLFYNAFFNNTLKSWNKDEINLLKQANANWTARLQKP
jgi:YHS domain-containing protein